MTRSKLRPAPSRRAAARAPDRSRVAIVGVAAIAALLVLGGAFLALRSSGRASLPAEVQGLLAIPGPGVVETLQLPSLARQTLVQAGPDALVTAARWAPDGSRLVYALVHRRAGDEAASGEIFLAGADGAEQRVLVARERPGDAAESPAWSPDGSALYFTYRGLAAGRTVERIERIELATGARRVVLDGAYLPTVSPDGQTLVAVRFGRSGPALIALPLSGGEPRTLVPEGRFVDLASPRFGPDGQLAFVASSGTTAGLAPGRAGAGGPLGWLGSALEPPAARAHGLPWDAWLVKADGADLRQLTRLNEDEPNVAWSPDGRWVAVYGPGGLHVVPSTGGEAVRVLERGGYGGIDWR